jgi:hypothetical protein
MVRLCHASAALEGKTGVQLRAVSGFSHFLHPAELTPGP